MKYYVVLRTWTNIVTCHVYPDEKDDSVQQISILSDRMGKEAFASC